ncbi:MAG: acyl carrier protein [Frankia sp.]
MPQQWGADEMLDVLVEQAGLPSADRPGDLGVTFQDIGLDSLAYIQLQAAVHEALGVEIPDDFPKDDTLAEILATVNAHLSEQQGVA